MKPRLFLDPKAQLEKSGDYTQYEKAPTFATGCDCWHHQPGERSAFMSQEKYIGMDVHQATISAAVMDAHGKLLMECLLETKRPRSLTSSRDCTELCP
jgi:hypothetical protein